MATLAPETPWHDLSLSAGEQAVINGALITATAPLHLQVGCGAFIQRERPDAKYSTDYAPARELYYRTLVPQADGWPGDSHHTHLIALLGQCVLQCRTRQTQEYCSNYAAALKSGDCDKALAAAHALALAERIVCTDYEAADTPQFGQPTANRNQA